MTTNEEVASKVRKMLECCEGTGKFHFNSRHFLSVGEWEIAFKGIYRFVEGNQKFKESMEPDYSYLKELFSDQIKFERLPVHYWN